MPAARLMAVAFIYVCTALAWSILGASVVSRTGESDARLSREVAQLWGGQHNQIAPQASLKRPRRATETVQETDGQNRPVRREVTKTVYDDVPAPLLHSRVNVNLTLDHRRKGLLWYDTYGVVFHGTYRLQNPDQERREMCVQFAFPSAEGLYDGFLFRVDGKEVGGQGAVAQTLEARADVPARGEIAVEVSYRSRGLGDWTYAFARAGVTQVEDFELEMTTDFRSIDFPAGTISPAVKTVQGEGWRLGWRFHSLVTGQKIGLDLPNKLNPGPVAARITFFAPVALLFFLTVMVILGLLSGQSLHPMNYFFLSAAFFSFHLLLAHLVDHLPVHASFLIASAVSLALVISYLRLVGGMRLALGQAGLAQFVFLVLFSYAFFFEGYTGLTVTVGAVLTLFLLMQLTARVDWAEVFAQRGAAAPGRPRS